MIPAFIPDIELTEEYMATHAFAIRPGIQPFSNKAYNKYQALPNLGPACASFTCLNVPLPKEILHKIFDFLRKEELSRCLTVSKQFFEVAKVRLIPILERDLWNTFITYENSIDKLARDLDHSWDPMSRKNSLIKMYLNFLKTFSRDTEILKKVTEYAGKISQIEQAMTARKLEMAYDKRENA